MSGWIITKADVDAFVSVAYRWTEAGQVDVMPPEFAQVLRVTDDNASDLGAHLWAANHDATNFGGPRRLADPELVTELEEGNEIVEMPPYEFQAFEGMPSPAVALNRASYFQYQTANDFWELRGSWENDIEPFELRFTYAMEWWACGLLQIRPKVRLHQGSDRVSWRREDGPVDHPIMLKTSEDRRIWRLSDADRNLFSLALEADLGH
jgi:hypothetical protein